MPAQTVFADKIVASFSDVSSDEQSSMAALGGNKYIVTWLAASGSGQLNTLLMARIVNVDGTSAGPAFPLVEAVSSDSIISSHEVTALIGGGYVVTWQNLIESIDGSSVTIYCKIFNDDGTARTDPFQVSSDGALLPRIAATQDGGFVVTWTTLDSSSVAQGPYVVKAIVFDSSGQATVDEFSLQDSGPTIYNRQSNAAAGSDGRVVIAFVDTKQTFGEMSDIVVQIRANDGAISEPIIAGVAQHTGSTFLALL
jgi:hypothetical protein